MKKHYILSRILVAFMSSSLSANLAAAMSQKPPATPKPTPSPTLTPSPTPKPVPSPTASPGREPAAVAGSITPKDFNVFSEVSYPVGSVVDTTYKSYRELLVTRNAPQGHHTDSCDPMLDSQDRFADRISYAVELKMQPSKAQLGYVASHFNMNGDINTYLPNSLVSHPLCQVTAGTLKTTLSGKNIPGTATITKINTFVNKMNQYRREALNGNRQGYVKASKLWTKYMMCLSYMESLTTADSAKAKEIAERVAPSDYRRPAGVNFYEDKNQPIESRLNIGLYQFTPDAGGNIQACIRSWNALYPKCAISKNTRSEEMIRILGSSMQTFNAFCAANKVTDMFSVQINAKSAYNTHPANVNANGTLKAPVDRCVSPHMSVGRSYNHFGPFQNTSGFTLDNIISCTLNGEY